MMSHPLDWVTYSDHPVVVRTFITASGHVGWEGASPHLTSPSRREQFLAALSREATLCGVSRAKPVFRDLPRDQPGLLPETCTPYLAANAAGFYITNVLPLVFVRNRNGHILPEARVALRYMRENATEFAGILDQLAPFGPRIFTGDGFQNLAGVDPLLVRDLAQPYTSFSESHMALRAGFYVKTPPGVATMIVPPVNQQAQLTMLAGLMESEWHHSEIFLVFPFPDFDGRALFIEPGTVLAQMLFIASGAESRTEFDHSADQIGADPAYRARSLEVGVELLRSGKPFVVSEVTGVNSISISCPHCFVSVTHAADLGVPPGHVVQHDFYRGYKALAAEYHKAVREREEGASNPSVDDVRLT